MRAMRSRKPSGELRTKTLAATLAILSATQLSGCYRYVPVSVTSPLPAERTVRIVVTEEEALRLHLPEIVPRSRDSLEGALLSSEADLIEVRMPSRDPARREIRDRDLFQRMAVRTDGILTLEVRELDRGRTFLTGGIGAAVVLGALLHGLRGRLGGDTLNPPQVDKD